VVKAKIEKILRHYKKKEITGKDFKSSAVLIPLFYSEGQYHVLFAKRSEEVDFHKGQVCFPGGSPEPCDASLLQTALREAEEEIGLKAEDAEVLGELDDSPTLTSGYVISPFVAFIPYPYPFKLNHREVEEIFSVPLMALINEANFRQDYYPADDKIGPGYAYEHEGHIIWGATARILKQFTELLRSETESEAAG
jgi:8-oxo-dGTP pyrophosphatase MutT (NUDIX family)